MTSFLMQKHENINPVTVDILTYHIKDALVHVMHQSTGSMHRRTASFYTAK